MKKAGTKLTTMRTTPPLVSFFLVLSMMLFTGARCNSTSPSLHIAPRYQIPAADEDAIVLNSQKTGLYFGLNGGGYGFMGLQDSSADFIVNAWLPRMVVCIAVDENERFVAVAILGPNNKAPLLGRIIVWNNETRAVWQDFELKNGWRVANLRFKNDEELVIVTDNGYVETWNVALKQRMKAFEYNKHALVRDFIFLKDKSKIFIGSMRHAAAICNLTTGEIEKIDDVPYDYAQGLALNSDGTKVYSIEYSGEINVWDLESFTVERSFALGSNEAFYKVLLYDNDSKLITASWTNGVIMWDLETESQVRLIAEHPRKSANLFYAADDELISVGLDRIVKTSLTTFDSETLSFPYSKGKERSLVQLSDGTLVSGSYDGTLRFRNSENGELVDTIASPYTYVVEILVTDSYMIVGYGNGNIVLYDIGTQEETQTLRYSEYLYALELTPDQTKLISASQRTISVTSLQDFSVIATLTSDNDVESLAATDTHFFSGNSDGVLEYWEITSKSRVFGNEIHFGHILELANNPLSGYVATGGSDDDIEFWTSENRFRGRSETHIGDVNFLEWREANYSTLFSGSVDKTIIVWEMSNPSSPQVVQQTAQVGDLSDSFLSESTSKFYTVGQSLIFWDFFASAEEFTSECEVTNNVWNPSDQECSDSCPYGLYIDRSAHWCLHDCTGDQYMDKTTRACVAICPEGSVTNAETKSCDEPEPEQEEEEEQQNQPEESAGEEQEDTVEETNEETTNESSESSREGEENEIPQDGIQIIEENDESDQDEGDSASVQTFFPFIVLFLFVLFLQ